MRNQEWVYGESGLSRGSGLFIGSEGVATNHHFLTPTDARNFEFVSGDYQLEVFAKSVGEAKAKLLTTVDLKITDSEALRLREPGFGIYFDWGPDSGRYQVHVDQRPAKAIDPLLLLEALHKGARDRPEVRHKQEND